MSSSRRQCVWSTPARGAARLAALGIVEQTVANWVKAHRAGKLRGTAGRSELTAEHMEIRRLRAELADILGKATAFFAKGQK